jgi:protein-S-isoprenylcysteine O-methyltransferase Ste14
MAPVFALAILQLAILPEERHLEARFGKEYLDYKARTRRWF